MAKVIINTTEGRQEIDLEGSVYREAQDAGFTNVRAYMNNRFDTPTNEPSAFDQACIQSGMIIGRNREYGIQPSTMKAVLEGPQFSANGSPISRDSVPTSRILFPAFIGAMTEDKLAYDHTSHVGQFNQMLALHDTINNDRIEWPELNFDKPEAARSKAVAQLAEPTAMGTITVSDKSFRVTGWAIGMEISDQAMRAGSSVSLDYVSLAIQRWALVEMSEEVNGHILAILNGDVDAGYAALSTIAGSTVTAQSFDASITTAGTLTQEAWVRFLYSKRRTIVPNWIITDLSGAMAIEKRTGRWTVQTDNQTSKRMDVIENIAYPSLPDSVNIFITDDPSWPANTLMAFDSNYAIHKITSTLLDYRASEEYAMRRSTRFRIDGGEAVRRLHDDAFMVMTLTVA